MCIPMYATGNYRRTRKQTGMVRYVLRSMVEPEEGEETHSDVCLSQLFV